MSERLQQLARKGALFGALLCCAQVAVAQEDVFTAPAGCETKLTVQTKECQVEHYYICADTGSDVTRVVFVEDGPSFISRVDGKAQWVSSMSLPDGSVTETVDIVTPIDVGALYETGEHHFEFTERWPSGREVEAKGWDRIIQRNVMVDGEVLDRTVFEVTYTDAESGALIETYTGSEYVSEKHMRFFSGKGTVETPDGTRDSFDRSPKEFIYPGEPGFASTTPRYDCGVLMSALD
jgi:hypothetical protein